MEIFLTLALFAAGILSLLWGGDRFVCASSWIAEKTGVPKFVIGATIVSLATTLPELFVSLLATMEGSVDMAVGNAVGSVTANLGLILGLSLAILPGRLEDSSFWVKGALMIAAGAFLCAFVLDGRLGLVESILLLALLLLFFRLNLRTMRQAGSLRQCPRIAPGWRETTRNLLWFGLGLSGILLGARLLVDNGSRMARMLGASEAFIGLTFVAVGTSLPELITTLTALSKGEPSLSVGNIIGANVIDLTMILSACAFASEGTLTVAPHTAAVDLPVALVLMAIAVIPAVKKRKFVRWQGILLLVLYAAYVAFLAWNV